MKRHARPWPRSLKIAIYLVCALGLVGVAAFTGLEHWQYSRQLDCGTQYDRRAHEICSSIERHLEYTCCGHAIISPGYRPTWTTLTDVWCEQQIDQKDVAVLRLLVRADDWRLASAAESLLRLLTGRDQYGTQESETSILHPANPSYLLKDGCSRKTQMG